MVDTDPDEFAPGAGQVLGGLREQRDRLAPRQQPGRTGGEPAVCLEVERPGHMPLGERDPAAQVHHPLPGGRPGGDLPGVGPARRREVHRRGPSAVAGPMWA
ncbi:hypothetical protein I2W78_01980 [Streptomyces spinoverrucosus]|nr:hypothetical protein [Streptomyces spinoverrucosus]